MTAFTRLTVVGSTARAEVVVPSDEPVASLSPALLDLIGEEPGSLRRPMTLVRLLGDPVDPLATLGEQGVLDGEIIRAVRADEAPPPPEVADVTDVVADAFIDRRDRWGTRTRLAVASGVVLAASIVLAMSALAVGGLGAAGLLLGIAAALVAGAILAGRLARRGIAVLAGSAALGSAATVVQALAPGVDPARPLVVVPLVAATVWIVIGLCIGVGLAQRSARWGAVVGLLLWLLGGVLLVTPLSTTVAAGIVGAVSIVVLGLLPWFALTTSGLTGLDDGTSTGTLPRRLVVHETLVQAYRSLDWATAAVALPLAASIAVLLLDGDVFAFCLGSALATVAALRTRTFPLALQGVILWSVPVVAAFAAALSPFPPPWVRLAIVVGLLVAAAVLATVRPVAHVRVRLRRLGNALELLAMVAVVPLLLGLFGLYADLLETFPGP
jgi:type VII secretion integral membrane protein EccD